MKNLFIFIIVLTHLNMSGQSIFKVSHANRSKNAYVDRSDTSDQGKKFYKIEAIGGANNTGFYPIAIPSHGLDTLRAIKELLSLEGDIRLCVHPITCYNPARSQIYLGDEKNYSIQVEALFLINQLIFKQPFNYSAYPILVDKKTRTEATISGEIIKSAFKAYKEWYSKIVKYGIPSIQSKVGMPLDDSPVRWY